MSSSAAGADSKQKKQKTDSVDYKALYEEAQRKLEGEVEEKEEIKRKLEGARAEIESLKASHSSEPSPQNTHGYVLSVSKAAKDDKARTQFYSNTLRRDPVKGGFVGSAVYRKFVLASNDTDKTKEAQEAKKDELVHAKALAQALKKTTGSLQQDTQSIFSLTKQDDEMQQSYVLALILAKLNSNKFMDIGHQFHVIDRVPDGTLILVSEQQESALVTSSNKANQEWVSRLVNENEVKQLDFNIDVFVSCRSNEGTIGPVAAIEYKPSDVKPEERVAQCDMYGCNLLTKTNRASIGIDIAGGLDVATWRIRAWGYFRSHDRDSDPYEKSLLFEGTGWDGLIGTVCGLEASCEAVIEDPSAAELKTRIGPVVCRDGEFVYKVYDDPTYRSPNLEVIQFMLDPKATASIAGKCTILQMKYFGNNWNKDISVEIFGILANKLKTLHVKFGPHGDIRLANLLSCGLIVDFDYVRKGTYPDNLNADLPDGQRHQDVKEAIDQNEVSYLTIEKVHDWHSFSAVMDLFEPTDHIYNDRWESAKEEFKKGDDSNFFSTAMAHLAATDTKNDKERETNFDGQTKYATRTVKLKRGIKIMGSGPTPEKK